MGADLIVFLSKGPRKFTKRSIEKATKRAKDLQSKARKLKTLVDRENWEEHLEEIRKLFNTPDFSSLQQQKGIDAESLRDYDYLDDLIKENVPKLIKEYVDWWYSCSGRDTAGRSDPDDKNKKIVVCGDMSWGDAPTGYGYTLMSKAECFNIPENLGIC